MVLFTIKSNVFLKCQLVLLLFKCSFFEKKNSYYLPDCYQLLYAEVHSLNEKVKLTQLEIILTHSLRKGALLHHELILFGERFKTMHSNFSYLSTFKNLNSKTLNSFIKI